MFKKTAVRLTLFLFFAFTILAFGFYHFVFQKKLKTDKTVTVVSDSSSAHNDIAILNIDKLLHESKAAKGIHEVLEGHRLKFQEEMKQHEENFMALEKILIEQQKNLTPEQFSSKRKEFDTKVAEVHQQVTQKRTEIESRFSQAMEKIQETILLLIRDMSVRNRYKLVVPRNFVIFREDGLEITDEILKELDEKLPVVELTLS